jgi:mannose/fructose/N-acetylgalactosamine-specific phosphotransferase system component IID
MSVLAGVASSLVLAIAPVQASIVIRLAFLGSFLGSIVWVLKKMLDIQKGRDVVGNW